MNLFDQLVTEALKNQPNLSSLRIVVEKELSYHDILWVMSHNHLLANLTLTGGTCLRCCYGGIRLSKNLDFTGGSDFTRDSLCTMGQTLIESLNDKYGLLIKVIEPIKDKKNVDTWKIKIETKPQQKHLPAQQINIDICPVPSYEKRPMILLNPYGIEMGTSGLIVQAQSREEIFADKLLAFALRPNRIKYRDLWDIVWLHQQALKPRFQLIPDKLRNRSHTVEYFLNLFDERKRLLVEKSAISSAFKQEMRRFLSIEQMNQIVEQDHLWAFVTYLIEDLGNQLHNSMGK